MKKIIFLIFLLLFVSYQSTLFYHYYLSSSSDAATTKIANYDYSVSHSPYDKDFFSFLNNYINDDKTNGEATDGTRLPIPTIADPDIQAGLVNTISLEKNDPFLIVDTLSNFSPFYDILDHIDEDVIYPTSFNHSDKSKWSSMYVIDMKYHRLRDPFYHLLDTMTFKDEDILSILQKIVDIWEQAGIFLRFKKSEALSYDDIDAIRAKAYFFYTFGHPIIQPNKRRTQIVQRSDREWLYTDGGPYQEYLQKVLPHYLDIRQSSKAMAALKSEPGIFASPRSGGADMDGNKLINRKEFEIWIKDKVKILGLNQNFDSDLAFDALQGFPDEQSASFSSESLMLVLQEPTSQSVIESRVVFRKFYLDFNISVIETAQFAEAMKYRPMLFLHYSIGRDSFENKLLRNAWDFQNMLHIYPVPYYHDMNGRGSTNWMDVVVRTSSCWDGISSSKSSKRKESTKTTALRYIQSKLKSNPFPVHCRWGVRWWEMHQQSKDEFSRMVSHEIGHTLGLQHPDPKCKVYSSLNEAELMQQQRVFSLQKWFDLKYCRCTTPSKCGNCGCDFDQYPDMYSAIASATRLTVEEVAIARESAASRDYRESQPIDNNHIRIGSSLEIVSIPDPLAGPILLGDKSDKDILVFSNLRLTNVQGILEKEHNKKYLVTKIRWKASFLFPRRDEGSGRPLHIPICWHVIRRVSGNDDDFEVGDTIYETDIDATRYTAHYEHTNLNITLTSSDLIGLSFKNNIKNQRARIAVGQTTSSSSNLASVVYTLTLDSNSQRKAKVVKQELASDVQILMNFDIKAVP